MMNVFTHEQLQKQKESTIRRALCGAVPDFNLQGDYKKCGTK